MNKQNKVQFFIRNLTVAAVIIFCLFLPSSGKAATTFLQSCAKEFLRESKSPGVSISLMKKGEKRPVTVVAGYACLENKVKMTPLTVMKVGSITKVFTGILTHILIDEGKLSLNTRLSRFFPSYVYGKNIRIKNLLTHTSGIPDMFELSPVVSNLCRPWRPQELFKMIEKRPLHFMPGSSCRYCNTNFLLLGMICQRLTGGRFFQAVLKKIAHPLGIKVLYEGDDTSIIPHLSCGYALSKKGKLQEPIMMSIKTAFATGDLITSSAQLVKLVNVDKLLKHRILDVVSPSPYILNNGKEAKKKETFSGISYYREFYDTFFIFTLCNKPLSFIGKLGMFPGFASCFLYDPVTKYAVAITSNLENASIQTLKLAIKILVHQRNTKGNPGY